MSNPDPAGDVQGPPDRQGDDPLDQQLSSYSFDLPEAAIAQRPVEPRHAARLLVVQPGEGAHHRTVWDLQEELRPGDLRGVNDTRVLLARLAARRASGGAVELLVLEPQMQGQIGRINAALSGATGQPVPGQPGRAP